MFEVPAAPTVANPIPDQTATAGGWFSYTLPADTFEHPDGEPLTYTASYTSTDLRFMPPEWLTFTASTRTVSGKAWPGGHLRVTVTATDPGGGSASDEFDIVVEKIIRDDDDLLVGSPGRKGGGHEVTSRKSGISWSKDSGPVRIRTGMRLPRRTWPSRV